MKKTLLLILLLIISFIFIRFFIGGPEDDWICENNQWVKHGNPRMEKPIAPCEK